MIKKEDVHIMLDLETLDLAPTAAVIQIGAAAFTIDGVFDTVQITIRLEEAIKHGTLDAGTLKFWMEQPDASRLSVISGVWNTKEALCQYEQWMSSLHSNPNHYWSHATFDFPVFNNMCRAIEEPDPHYYKDCRDIRTLQAIVEADHIERQGVHHTAKDDAVFQAKCLITQLRKII